jgi:hypothetical protein
VELEVLEEQEQHGAEAPPSSELYQRYHLAKKTKGCYALQLLDERIALDGLRANAAKAPEIREQVNERLAKPFDPGQCPSDWVLRADFGGDDAAAQVPQRRSGNQKVPTFDALKAFRESK